MSVREEKAGLAVTRLSPGKLLRRATRLNQSNYVVGRVALCREEGWEGWEHMQRPRYRGKSVERRGWRLVGQVVYWGGHGVVPDATAVASAPYGATR